MNKLCKIQVDARKVAALITLFSDEVSIVASGTFVGTVLSAWLREDEQTDKVSERDVAFLEWTEGEFTFRAQGWISEIRKGPLDIRLTIQCRNDPEKLTPFEVAIREALAIAETTSPQSA